MATNFLRGVLFGVENLQKMVPIGDGHPARNMGQTLPENGKKALRAIFRDAGKTKLQQEAMQTALDYVMTGKDSGEEYVNGIRGSLFRQYADRMLALVLASRPADDHDKQMRVLADTKKLFFKGIDRMYGFEVEVRVIHNGLQWKVSVTKTRGREVDLKDFTYSDYREARAHMEHIRLSLVRKPVNKAEAVTELPMDTPTGMDDVTEGQTNTMGDENGKQ